LSKHATSRDTAEPGAPCSGNTLNQLTPLAAGGGSKGVVVGLDDCDRELGSLGLEQAVVSTPTLTVLAMLAMTKKTRTLMPAQYAAPSATCTADAPAHGRPYRIQPGSAG
jgi:hypothetical protein